jgi:hypothetical protein
MQGFGFVVVDFLSAMFWRSFTVFRVETVHMKPGGTPDAHAQGPLSSPVTARATGGGACTMATQSERFVGNRPIRWMRYTAKARPAAWMRQYIARGTVTFRRPEGSGWNTAAEEKIRTQKIRSML